MLEREDIIEAVSDLDDPEELIADLILELESWLESGDLTPIEELLQGIDEMVNVRGENLVVKSWREFYGEEDEFTS